MIDTSNQDTSRQYLFWKAQFNNYVNYTGATDEEKLGILVNKIEVGVYDYIEGIDNINDALVRLDEVFNKKANEVFRKSFHADSIFTFFSMATPHVQSFCVLFRCKTNMLQRLLISDNKSRNHSKCHANKCSMR